MKCVRNSVTSQDLHLYMIEMIRNNGKGIAGQKSWSPVVQNFLSSRHFAIFHSPIQIKCNISNAW